LLSQVVREQAAASDKIAVQKQDLQQTRDRVKELEQQLQELTDIEQSIRQRETPVEQKEK
jgi:G3E family GTPase